MRTPLPSFEIVLQRLVATPNATVGELFINGEHECFTLEDMVRPDGIKIAGETAIPAGRYKVALTWSRRFNQVMPLLLNVAGFVGIRIHWGNTAKDTDGCILVGTDRSLNAVVHSRVAYEQLFAKLNTVSDGSRLITIDVRNVAGAAPTPPTIAPPVQA